MSVHKVQKCVSPIALKNQVYSFNEEDSNSLVPTLDRTHFESLKKSNQIVAGMIPKLTNCFDAIEGRARGSYWPNGTP